MSIWVSAAGEAGLLERDEAKISVFDHGLTVGDGAFETLKVVGGTALAVTRHLNRLTKSCRILGLTPPDTTTLLAAITEVIDSEPEASRLGRLRITCTGGVGPLASDRGDAEGTVIVAVTPMQPWSATTNAVMTPWVRNERSSVTGAKCTSYAENVAALAWAHQRGFSEGLFANTVGELCEGTGTNIFIVRDGVALTPPSSSGCLEGITRELLVEWELAQQATLMPSDVEAADEVFLTSSTRDVHPVVHLGDRHWTEPGPVTRHIAAQYVRRITQDIDP